MLRWYIKRNNLEHVINITTLLVSHAHLPDDAAVGINNHYFLGLRLVHWAVTILPVTLNTHSLLLKTSWKLLPCSSVLLFNWPGLARAVLKKICCYSLFISLKPSLPDKLWNTLMPWELYTYTFDRMFTLFGTSLNYLTF